LPSYTTQRDLAAGLATTLSFAGHSQPECVRILQDEFGLRYASQSNVSRWASARAIPRGAAAVAICGYIGKYGPPDRRAEEENEGDGTDPVLRLERQLTGEPSLGLRQRALVDVLTSRLGRTEGSSLTTEDVRVAAWLSEVLGFPKPL
jgi:hypothetical protein